MYSIRFLEKYVQFIMFINWNIKGKVIQFIRRLYTSIYDISMSLSRWKSWGWVLVITVRFISSSWLELFVSLKWRKLKPQECGLNQQFYSSRVKKGGSYKMGQKKRGVPIDVPPWNQWDGVGNMASIDVFAWKTWEDLYNMYTYVITCACICVYIYIHT